MKTTKLQFTLVLLCLSQIVIGFEFSDLQSQRSTLPKLQAEPVLPLIMTDLSGNTNGTQGYYLSPHALSQQSQVDLALKNISSALKIGRTQYNHSQSTYVMQNFVIDLDYNDGKQKIEIDHEEVLVQGGTIFFGYKFNYSVTSPTRSVKGYAHGSVYSDSLSYRKVLGFNNQGLLQWKLAKNNGYMNVAINNNRMDIKRMQPFDQNDHDVMIEMMDRAFQNIKPGNIKYQILQNFNFLFPFALNDSLNHQVFGDRIDYSYHHPTQGQLKMSIIHHLWDFGIDQVDGYKIIYVTQIQGHQKQSVCNMTVPNEHQDFKIYGGIQNIHLHCLYQDVVNFIQSKGWLDTQLNSAWQVNAFQFYAGDLFDMMNNLYTKVSPLSILEGDCKASATNLVLKPSIEFDSNSYSLKVTYNCNVQTTSKTAQTLQILKFVAQTKFYINVYADKLALNFQISEADIISLSFTPVNNFIVTNMNLALFKAGQVINKNIKAKVFGTGFPSIPRESPKTRVDANWTIYYDTSALNSTYLFHSI